MVFLLLMTNLFDPRAVISQICPGLQVEKRKKKRPLQMSRIIS